MSGIVAMSALYYRTCPVPYRMENQPCTLDFQNQPLHKYKYPHIGIPHFRILFLRTSLCRG